MGRINRNGKFRKKVALKKSQAFEPQVFVDYDADFASIKIAPGIEARSYLKDGFVFSEDKKGRVIEVQVLNLSELGKNKTNPAA
jgi:hypothetical protein